MNVQYGSEWETGKFKYFNCTLNKYWVEFADGGFDYMDMQDLRGLDAILM